MAETPVTNAPRHPIRIVALRTGLTPDVIRAWERRYGVTEPARGDAGHRLYSDRDVERLGLLARAVTGGRHIGQIAGLGNAELAELVGEDERARHRQGGADESDGARSLLARCRHAVERLAPAELRDVLQGALLRLGVARFADEILHPLLVWIGERWHAGALGPAQEHAASAVIRRSLDWIAATLDPSTGAPVLVLGTPAGERHELGAMLAGVAAGMMGWHTLYLGCDLPVEEIISAANRSRARALGLSVVAPEDPRRVIRDIEAVRRGLDSSTVLVLGGAGAAVARGRERNGAMRVVKDLADFRALLRELAGPGAVR